MTRPGTAPVPPPEERVPYVAPFLSDRIAGLHLEHLRTCQGLTVEEVADEVSARSAHRPGPGHIDALEGGTSVALRRAASGGALESYLAGYRLGGRVARSDYYTVFAPGAAGPDECVDKGPGWPHRLLLLEQRSEEILYAASTVVPVALRTRGYDDVLWAKGVCRLPPGLPTPATAALTGVGCQLCQVYRADLLTDRDVAGAWVRAVRAAQRAALTERLARPGPPVTALLNETLLRPFADTVHAHADQMGHLAHLVRTTRLTVRFVSLAGGATVIEEAVRLTPPGTRRPWTVRPGFAGAHYVVGVPLGVAMAEERALDPATSLGLLEDAAAGAVHKLGSL
ncbi:Scr1 family TA system antitoxin-like transcriptional regulator [Kitasatospora sp. NPDC002965]|uniref:Scr1 family TA system antitoxin-like transcriptional regulator n=1 Tax=Kitasatospora sp. NPDC002965 TaxID=3154775 RepID=UPI0033BABA10